MNPWANLLILAAALLGASLGALLSDGTPAAVLAGAAAAGFCAWAVSVKASAEAEEDLDALVDERSALQREAEQLADRLELIRGVFEASSELVGCVTEEDARARFAATLRRYWDSDEAFLLLWERGAWRSLGGQAMPPPPDLSERIRLPPVNGQGDLVLDLSGGVDGQAAVVLRGAVPQPPLHGRPASEHAAVAEVLAGQLALSLRRVVLYRSLQAMARFDQLTGCCRRWYGETRLRELCDQGAVVAVIILDLDRFKEVNDRHGHAAGDQVLAAVGHCLGDQVRGHDLVCRWGGEEFLVVLPKTDTAGAELVAIRLRSAISRLADLPVAVTASAGVAACTLDESCDDLVNRADRALAEAKLLGRDRTIIAQPPQGATVRVTARKVRTTVPG